GPVEASRRNAGKLRHKRKISGFASARSTPKKLWCLCSLLCVHEVGEEAEKRALPSKTARQCGKGLLQSNPEIKKGSSLWT
ncbi:MAG: hypothetical protein K8I01_13270, partial [Candidatus Methylomirabilis sp.]|nr:hypothetical protein [Deltaproteobacteria bacterium]